MNIPQLYEIFQQCGQNITIDSRKIEQGCLFFALKGEKFNANEFAKYAITNGAKYAVISDSQFAIEGKTIVVEDTLITLQQLAKYHRNQLKTKIFGITGSNGKTTTKELIYRVLSKKYNAFATQGNLNNHIGVPLTLLSLTNDYEYAIVEMGANHIGEIAELCELSQPEMGLITNIGRAHIGTFGNFENLVKTKLGLFEAIKNRKGLFLLNSSDVVLNQNISGMNIIKYGNADDSLVRCVETDSSMYLNLKVKVENKVYSVNTKLVGAYNTDNILAAITAGLANNIEINEIIDAIAKYVPSNNRSQLMNTEQNTLILDMYNANPTSMKAAIENFSHMTVSNKMLIIGDMLELGDYALIEHQQIVDLIVSLKFCNVILVGLTFGQCSNTDKFLLFANNGELCNYLKNNDIEHKTILVKGSNGIGLKSIIEFL